MAFSSWAALCQVTGICSPSHPPLLSARACRIYEYEPSGLCTENWQRSSSTTLMIRPLDLQLLGSGFRTNSSSVFWLIRLSAILGGTDQDQR